MLGHHTAEHGPLDRLGDHHGDRLAAAWRGSCLGAQFLVYEDCPGDHHSVVQQDPSGLGLLHSLLGVGRDVLVQEKDQELPHDHFLLLVGASFGR